LAALFERLKQREKTIILGLIGWVMIGLLVGCIASKIVDLRGDDPRLGLVVACGGVAGVVIWHRMRSREPYTRRSSY
jgi:uncharacterized membrane protein (DUF441 family)